MQPLSVKTSKTTAKVTIVIIWLIGVCLASPMAVFHKFSYVYDENGNGLKPFCSPVDMDPVTDLLYVDDNDEMSGDTGKNTGYKICLRPYINDRGKVVVVPQTIHPFPRCPKPARESRLLCPFHLYIDIYVVYINVGNIARIYVVKLKSM